MSNKIKFFTVGGLEFSAQISAFVGLVVMWLVFTGISVFFLGFSPAKSMLGGLIGVAIHIFSMTAHQIGHAFAARRTGYPMSGIAYWGILSSSLYPHDEPELPARTHIRRALGGIPVSIVLAIVGLVVLVAMGNSDSLKGWLVRLFVFENFIVFGLGSFLPLGFTDGSTLLYWRNKN